MNSPLFDEIPELRYEYCMFNLGLPELILVFVVTLLVFGPKRLPELAKGLGKGIRDFKKALEGHDDNEKLPPGPNVPSQT